MIAIAGTSGCHKIAGTGNIDGVFGSGVISWTWYCLGSAAERRKIPYLRHDWRWRVAGRDDLGSAPYRAKIQAWEPDCYSRLEWAAAVWVGACYQRKASRGSAGSLVRYRLAGHIRETGLALY